MPCMDGQAEALMWHALWGAFPATIRLMGESPSAADPRIPAAYRPGQFPELRRRKISRVSGTRHTVRISRDRATMPTVVPDHHRITTHGLAALPRALQLPSRARNP